METEKSDNDADSVEILLVGDPPSVAKKATATVTTTVIKKKGTRGHVAGPEMLKMLCNFIPVPAYMIQKTDNNNYHNCRYCFIDYMEKKDKFEEGRFVGQPCEPPPFATFASSGLPKQSPLTTCSTTTTSMGENYGTCTIIA